MLLEEDPFVGEPVPRGKDKNFSLIQFFAIWVWPSPSYLHRHTRGNHLPYTTTQNSIYIRNITPICMMSIIVVLHQFESTFFLSEEGQPTLRIPIEAAINFTNTCLNFITLQNTVSGTENKIFKPYAVSPLTLKLLCIFCFSDRSPYSAMTFCRVQLER